MIELNTLYVKPCPFCGEDLFWSDVSYCWKHQDNKNSLTCIAYDIKLREKYQIDSWNRRNYKLLNYG